MRLFVEHLTVIDSAYLDPERGLVGDSWIVDLELGGALDDQGMMMDFGHVKKRIKQHIDDTVDHRLLVPLHAEGLEHRNTGERVFQTLCFANGLRLTHEAPEHAIYPLLADRVTAAALTNTVRDLISEIVPENVTDIGITLRHEAIDGAFYHYTHGLKKHEGNCQRIAHGHRSRIVIERSGVRDHALEAEWAARLNDIHIATRADLVTVQNGICYFAYDGSQGHFELTMPESRCYFIDTDSTVEWIAHHIATRLKEAHPADAFTVRAYEGVHKGAIASN